MLALLLVVLFMHQMNAPLCDRGDPFHAEECAHKAVQEVRDVH